MHWMMLLAAAIVSSQLANYATSLYLHRSLSHRSVRLTAPARLGARTIIWTFTGIRPREWAAVHRYHHDTVDTQADPHSPQWYGVWRIFFTNARLYRRQVRAGVDPRCQRGLEADRLDRLVFDHTLLGLVVGLGAAIAVFGAAAGAIVFVLHGILYIHANSAVNAFCHYWGDRPNPNPATNLPFLALVTAGESNHNNHHARPAIARLDWQPGTIDPGWWVIWVLCRLRLAELPGAARTRRRPHPRGAPVEPTLGLARG